MRSLGTTVLTDPAVIHVVSNFSSLHFPYFSTFPALISSFPFSSSGHFHCAIDVDVEQIERLARGQEMEEDSGQFSAKRPPGNECGVKIEV